MKEFYNSYQFVPVKKIPHNTDHEKNRHDLWDSKKKSGRIICTLTLETPTVIGLIHDTKTDGDKTETTLIEPATRCFGDQQSYYIPGNSLRGMISSIAEAITQSSLRVLDNKPLKSVIDFNRKKYANMGKVHDYFQNISPDLLPLGVTQRGYPTITVAEALFGVVEITNKNAAGKEQNDASAIASRLAFSDARLVESEVEPVMSPITLNILGSPKSNSCNMYFHPIGASEGYVKQGELNADQHQANGRKFYLHATAKTIKNKSWEYNGKRDKRDNLRPRCIPFADQQTFVFHIDFENLDDQELGVLLISLRPKKNFRHKLGMGKPLGLGTVRVDIEGIFETNRKDRYGIEALNQKRFTTVSTLSNCQTSEQWKQYYVAESEAWKDMEKEDFTPDAKLIDQATLSILQRIGQFPHPEEASEFDLDYPNIVNEKGEKTGNGYEWYVTNKDVEHGGEEFSLPAVKADQPLPRMKTYKE